MHKTHLGRIYVTLGRQQGKDRFGLSELAGDVQWRLAVLREREDRVQGTRHWSHGRDKCGKGATQVPNPDVETSNDRLIGIRGEWRGWHKTQTGRSAGRQIMKQCMISVDSYPGAWS